ncbi:MAG: hypothetical protein JO118_08645, partial [Acetobacteraceae bacterium]|nr:hypothetical protein [Acetobacteraceae bacterium]
RQRAEIIDVLTQGVDPATLEAMADALVMMKASLVRSAQARREAEAEVA